MEPLEFDYVIVGAGSAGCVLANRLTENGKFSALVLESGQGDARFWVKVPLGYAVNVTNPAVNWGYETQPDPGLDARTTSWPRGKIIGGSGSINAMAYMRGLARDFDDWAAAGATGWHWDNVRAVYERMETRSEITAEGRRSHGTGPVVVSDLSDQMAPFSRHFLDAAQEVGYSTISDLNAPGADGIGYYRSTVRKGYRWSSADAFLRPALRRPNLCVMKTADVDHLVHDNGRVTGVAFRRGGAQLRAKARKEVIICAGAINSPKLLQQSGFGPTDLLRRHGIPVAQNLPQVGRGLQDHLAISYQFHAAIPTLNNTLGNGMGKLWAGAKYLLTRKGPLAVPVNQVGGYVGAWDQSDGPDMQLYFNPVSYGVNASGKVVPDRTAGFQISAQPCRPTSTGTIEIGSANPHDAPLIAARSLATPHDMDAAVSAGRVLQRFANAASLRAVMARAKAPDLLAMDDEALLADFRVRASTVYHPTCTCRMGRTSQDSVLDARLRVHGVSGLRVADASSFPNITSGNTNAPVMMLAMRAADLILEDAL
jgi:choline dehydrogenase